VSPSRAIRYKASTTGATPSSVLVSWRKKSRVGRPGASEPLRVAVCLPSDLLAVSEPIRSTKAYRPLPPSETAKTAMISHQSSFRVGRTQRPAGTGAAAGVVVAGGAGVAGGVEDALASGVPPGSWPSLIGRTLAGET